MSKVDFGKKTRCDFYIIPDTVTRPVCPSGKYYSVRKGNSVLDTRYNYK